MQGHLRNEREREGGIKHTDRKTETDRLTDRQAGRQAGRQAETERETDIQTEPERCCGTSVCVAEGGMRIRQMGAGFTVGPDINLLQEDYGLTKKIRDIGT